jgi:hypothetical protein
MKTPKGRNTVTSAALTHEQAVVLALAALGGDVRLIDTEDIAVHVDQIAPGRFRWRKYLQFINNELVHTALRDAKRLRGLVRGSGKEGWQLTSAGLELAKEFERLGIGSAQPRRRLDHKEKVWLQRERARLLAEEAYRKFLAGGIESVSRKDAERFFRLDEYVTGQVRNARLQRIVNSFADDGELSSAIRALAEKAA